MRRKSSVRAWFPCSPIAVALGLGLSGLGHAQCIQGDVNGDGIVNGIDLSYVLTNWGQTCPAVIESVSPASGPLAGGTAITITGSQLGGVQSVTIGGAPATNVVGVDSATVTAVTPPSKSLGPKDVVLTTTSGVVILPAGFSYTAISWGSVLEHSPDPKVVTDAGLREAIIATGLPWRVRDNVSHIELLLVPPGTFAMGCSPSQQWPCIDNESPIHEVDLTAAFYLGRFEVTQAEWTAVIGSNPSGSSGYPDSPSRPVNRVSWNMIQGFEAATGLRLPTEAEWEYACRAGTVSAFNNGSDDDTTLEALGWFSLNSDEQIQPVGQKLANALGLHDMHGNVWEWVEDWYSSGYYAESPPSNPEGPGDGSRRVLRGGGWNTVSGSCRVSRRFNSTPGNDGSGDGGYGFRMARTP